MKHFNGVRLKEGYLKVDRSPTPSKKFRYGPNEPDLPCDGGYANRNSGTGWYRGDKRMQYSDAPVGEVRGILKDRAASRGLITYSELCEQVETADLTFLSTSREKESSPSGT